MMDTRKAALVRLVSLVGFAILLLDIEEVQVSGSQDDYHMRKMLDFKASLLRSKASLTSPSESYDGHMRKIQEFKASLLQQKTALISPSPNYDPRQVTSSRSEYRVTSYGADPTGKTDSTEALLQAFSEACNGPSSGFLMDGIRNLGGVQINLEGGNYLISRPLRFPASGVGNIMIHGGTLHVSPDFPVDRYLIELSSPTSTTRPAISSAKTYNFEFVTFKDLMLNCNYRGGGIAVIDSLRIGIDNCYIAHFTSNGILVQSGHETMIRDSFIGQHITAGNDPGESIFSGTGIALEGNDNVLSNVVIFSAETGVLVSGQANLLNAIHCYNKATGFGGTGIYVKLPGKTETRIVNSYLDYTGIVAEDPVQLMISNNFFLGDAFITLRSINGIVNNVNIVDNMFSGSGKGMDIVQLDQGTRPFMDINQVVVDRNTARGMNVKSTICRGTTQGEGSSWTIDFNSVLLFPNLIRHVQFSTSVVGTLFPSYTLRNTSGNCVVIESNMVAPTSVYVTIDQASGT